MWRLIERGNMIGSPKCPAIRYMIVAPEELQKRERHEISNVADIAVAAFARRLHAGSGIRAETHLAGIAGKDEPVEPRLRRRAAHFEPMYDFRHLKSFRRTPQSSPQKPLTLR
jgi:hypothetical protein